MSFLLSKGSPKVFLDTPKNAPFRSSRSRFLAQELCNYRFLALQQREVQLQLKSMVSEKNLATQCCSTVFPLQQETFPLQPRGFAFSLFSSISLLEHPILHLLPFFVRFFRFSSNFRPAKIANKNHIKNTMKLLKSNKIITEDKGINAVYHLPTPTLAYQCYFIAFLYHM